MVVDKKMLCKRMLKFLRLSDVVSLDDNELKFFEIDSEVLVHPVFHECSFLAKLLQSERCCQSFPFVALCDVILNEIVVFTFRDDENFPPQPVFKKNPFFKMSAEEVEVFLDVNEDARV